MAASAATTDFLRVDDVPHTDTVYQEELRVFAERIDAQKRCLGHAAVAAAAARAERAEAVEAEARSAVFAAHAQWKRAKSRASKTRASLRAAVFCG